MFDWVLNTPLLRAHGISRKIKTHSELTNETKYSRMDQVIFVEDNLSKM